MERSDALASRLGVSLRGLAPVMGMSVASLFGYRNGSIPISGKAWSKLEQTEAMAFMPVADEPPMTFGEEPTSEVDKPSLVQAAEDMVTSLANVQGEVAELRKDVADTKEQLAEARKTIEDLLALIEKRPNK